MSEPARNTCEICRSGEARFVFKSSDRNREVDKREFSIHRCMSCGLGFTIPKLSANDVSKYYTAEYYSLDSNLKLEEATRPHNQVRVNRIRRYIQSGSLLDIGAGTGMFLKTAKANGYEGEGLEISPDAAGVGVSAWGLNIRVGDLRSADFSGKRYDVVTLGHVYEHLHEPRAAAEQLASLVRPGGLLVIAVPNFSSLQARVFGPRWFHLDVPRHLYHYTPASMTMLIQEAGFVVRGVTFYSAEHNWAGILGSIMQLSRPGESPLHKFIRKGFGVPIARLLAFCEAALGRGGTFEVYAVKL